MPALPNELPKDMPKVGVLIGLACSGRLITPELVVAMGVQPAPTHFSTATLCVKGYEIAAARNLLAEKSLECGAKYLWFIDDDTVPPPNSLRRLVYVLDNHPKIKAIGGCYVTKSDPPQPVLFRGKGAGSFWHWKKDDVFEVTGIGAGCLLINTDFFREVPGPWFTWDESVSFDSTVPSSLTSEDITFCDKVQKAGYHVFAHGGILCDHFDVVTGKTFQFTPDMYPLNNETYALETTPTPKLASAVGFDS
jgi:hypothetical protein